MLVQHRKNLPCNEEEEAKEKTKQNKKNYRLSTSYVSETVLGAFSYTQ